jgi:hypothetical protein
MRVFDPPTALDWQFLTKLRAAWRSHNSLSGGRTDTVMRPRSAGYVHRRRHKVLFLETVIRFQRLTRKEGIHLFAEKPFTKFLGISATHFSAWLYHGIATGARLKRTCDTPGCISHVMEVAGG